MEKEIWKDISGYIGLYQVSNLGRVKSVSRDVIVLGKYKKFYPGKIRKFSKNDKGYFIVYLFRNGDKKKHLVHKLVSNAFLGESDLTVNHLDLDKTNNKLPNLELTTQRRNTMHYFESKNRGLPLGVSKHGSGFMARIYVNGKDEYLGTFKNPNDASIAYQNALYKVENGHEINLKKKEA